MFIRLAQVADASAIQAIYVQIVRDTIISFEMVPPSVADMAQRITTTLEQFPWLVATQDEAVIGYAYASRHHERAGYQWSVNVSCYIHADWRGKGIGRALYTALFAILAKQGYYRVFAGITLPNPGSTALHEAMGMRLLGIYQQAGFKSGAWHDVSWLQASLQLLSEQPAPPRPLPMLIAEDPLAVQALLRT